MLRIDLLPDYIGDKNKINKLIGGWVLIVIVVVVGLLGWYGKASAADQAAIVDRASKEDKKSQTDKNKQVVSDEKANRAKIEQKQTFVKNAKLYNDGWADVFETIRDVKPSDNSIILNSMSVDSAAHKTVSLTGFGQSETAIVRWWMSLRNNTALFDHVNFDLTPHAYLTASASRGGGMGSMMGPGSGGMGGGMSGGGPTMGVMGAGGGKMMGTMGPMGGGGMGGASSKAGNGPTELEGKPGINFTATVVLKTPLAGGVSTPSWPGGGGAAAGGMGGMGGMGGGGIPPTGSGGPNSGGGNMPASVGGGAKGAM